MLQFVIPGVYISKNSSLSSGGAVETIRVLGEDDDKPDYFKILNQERSLSESYILENYDYMPTSTNEAAANKHNNDIKKEINLGDLDEVNNKVDNNFTGVNQMKNIVTTIPKDMSVQQPLETPVHFQQTIQPTIVKQEINPEQIILQRTIESVKTTEIKDFNLNITISTNYDIEKLINISSLLDLNINSLLIEILQQPNVQQNIINELINKVNNPEPVVKLPEVIEVVPEVIKQEKIVIAEPYVKPEVATIQTTEIITKTENKKKVYKNIDEKLEEQSNKVQSFLETRII